MTRWRYTEATKAQKRICCAAGKMATVEVHRWIAEGPYDAFKGPAKTCQEAAMDEKRNGRNWVPDDDEARNVVMKSIMLRSEDFFRHAVSGTEG